MRWSVFPADAISVRRFFQQSVCVNTVFTCFHMFLIERIRHMHLALYYTAWQLPHGIIIERVFFPSCSIERSIYCMYVAMHNVTKSKGMFLPSWLSIVWQLSHGMSIEIHALIIFQNNKSYPAWWL